MLCVAQTFDLSDVEYHGRWIDTDNFQFYDQDFTAELDIHANVNDSNSAFIPVIQQMAGTWSAESGTFFNIMVTENQGSVLLTQNSAGPISGDWANTIGFDLDNQIYPADTQQIQGYKKRLAVTMTRLVPIGNCDNWWYPALDEADIFLNPIGRYFAVYQSTDFEHPHYDLGSVVIHEMGHVAGLRHHPTASPNDVMHTSLNRGAVITTLSPLDRFAITSLYDAAPGSGDEGQISSIPCTSFKYGTQWLAGSVNDGTCQCDGLDFSCTCNGNQRVISQEAERNLVFFVTGGDENHWTPTKNLYALQFETIKAQDELLALAKSTDQKLLPLRLAFADFHAQVTPLVEASFRCLKCPSTIDLTIKTHHIDASVSLINAALPHLSSAALISELKKLRDYLPNAKGKRLREATMDFDFATLN